MNFILRTLLSAAAVFLIANFLSGVQVDGYTSAIIVALVLGVLFAVLKPILVILTLPVTILTLGLFLLVINALVIMLAGNLVSGFTVNGFWTAFIFSILLSVVESILHSFIKD